MKLSPHRLTHGSVVLAFAVCVSLVTSTWPLAHAELYLQNTTPVAAPQCISGRTSYLHVRLAFHPYPQLIPQFCNTGEFGPRRTVTSASPWPWIAHVVSGRIGATKRLFQTRFPSGCPPLAAVNQATPMHSPDHSTKGTPSALACSCKSRLCLLLRTELHALFPPPLGGRPPFPSASLSAVGRAGYSASEVLDPD